MPSKSIIAGTYYAAPKPKKCKACKAMFLPIKPLQQVCDFGCAIELNLINRAKNERKELADKRKKERAELREFREKNKSHAAHKQEAQDFINRYITKVRDVDAPCISCGEFRDAYDAGHYLPRSTRPQLAFDEDNIHKQCVWCNQYRGAAALPDYRRNLILKIGVAKVERLEGYHPERKWSVDELKATKELYKSKIKSLEGR